MGLVKDIVKPLFKKFKTFEDVERAVLEAHPQADIPFLRRAHDFAERAHEGQFRKSGEPYITHPRAVAFILAKSKVDIESIAAGFLHDVIEDCEVGFDDLKNEFGEHVAQIVDGVTKIGKVKFRDKTEAQAENYRKMLLAMARDVRVLIVKLADRCHNMKTLGVMREDKRRRIAQETQDIYLPLAHRIGMSILKSQLEELTFKNLDPEAYENLTAQLNERERRQSKFISGATKHLRKLMTENDVEADISSRIKSKYSIYRKMQRKHCTLDGLYDYYAFRIITQSVGDCYKILGLLHAEWQHIPGRIKDFIATPKVNMYQSLHTTLLGEGGVRFEVQIRTVTMHRIAEEGLAAHWSYKNGRLLEVSRGEFEAWVARMADDQKDISDKDEFLESVKDNFAAREILVFTPQEEIKTLTAGATALDFAYMIHTEVGHRAVGAKVDGKQVPLNSELQSGSIVEIQTSQTQKTTESRLAWVKTHSARAKIRAFLRAEEKVRAVEEGRALFEKELKKNKIPLKSVTKDAVTAHLSDFGKKKLDDFYSAIGFGSITAKQAVQPFLDETHQAEQEAVFEQHKELRLNRALNKASKKSHNLVRIQDGDLDGILVTLATCCNPILGDAIVGFITQGRGISVHKRSCRSFNEKNVNPERKVAVAWEDGSDQQVFIARLRIYTENRPGMIADISSAIQSTKTPIQSLDAAVNEDKAQGEFDIAIQIHTLDHLQKVTGNLKRISGVLSVERKS